MGMVYAPIAQTMADKAKKMDPRLLPVIITPMMLIVFGDAVASRTVPILGKNFVAALISAVCTVIIFLAADKLKRPHLKEYALVIAMLVGMFGTYALFGRQS